jgi:hypothetical protein
VADVPAPAQRIWRTANETAADGRVPGGAIIGRMAQQGTDEKTEPAGDEGAAQGSPAAESEGRHAASEEHPTEAATAGTTATGTTADAEGGSPEPAPGTTDQPTEKVAPAEQPTEKVAPADRPTEKVAPAERPTERQPAAAAARPAEPSPRREPEPTAGPRHRSIDLGELAWRTGNVLATVVNTLAVLFALVLVVNVVLVVVGVNPANGVAQFVSAVAGIVIVGFRDLFVPANPVLMLTVNSLVAAAFWVFVGQLVSRVVRFLAARVN